MTLRRWVRAALAAAALLPACSDAPQAAAPTTSSPTTTTAAPLPPQCLHLGLPAYVSPAELRSTAIHDAVRYVVLNPSNGPDVERDEELARSVLHLQAEGVLVLGYVHTSYGARPVATIGEEIERYRTWYGVDGTFVDEVTNTPDGLPYYRQVAAHVRERSGDVLVLNPGTPSDPGYDEIADVLVTFEDEWEAYRDLAEPIPPTRADQWHLVLGADRDEMLQAVGLAADRGATILDVTDVGLEETWNRLPTHLAEQAAEVGRVNRARRCVS